MQVRYNIIKALRCYLCVAPSRKNGCWTLLGKWPVITSPEKKTTKKRTKVTKLPLIRLFLWKPKAAVAWLGPLSLLPVIPPDNKTVAACLAKAREQRVFAAWQMSIGLEKRLDLEKTPEEKGFGAPLVRTGGLMISETTGLWMESQNWPVKMDLYCQTWNVGDRKYFWNWKKEELFFLPEAEKSRQKNSETHYLPP